MKNLIIMVLDDLGYKDMSFFGSELHTPALDSLAESAIKFTQFNGQPICSPARASLMTGLYGYKNGTQELVTNKGLDLNLSIIPQLLKNSGYTTYMVGKWHLGMVKPYLPQNRGFDYHFGSYDGAIDYWTHIIPGGAYDFYENGHAVDPNNREHATELQLNAIRNRILGHNVSTPFFFYMPFNAPHVPYKTFPYFQSHTVSKNWASRPEYAALLCHLDYCIGKIISALKHKGLYNNTYIWVTGDNGGTPSADIRPLRNNKTTFYEGGLRVPNFLLGPTISPSQNNNAHHMVDMMPTVFNLLGLPLGLSIDGIDVFASQPANREFVYYLRRMSNGDFVGCIRVGQYKLLKFDITEMYDLVNDPYESHDISHTMPAKRDELLNRLRSLAPAAKFNMMAATEEKTSMAYALGLAENEPTSPN